MIVLDPDKQKLRIEVIEPEEKKPSREEEAAKSGAGLGLLPNHITRPNRRRRKAPSGGELNVYDLAQIKQGDIFVDRDVSYLPPFNINTSGGGNPPINEALEILRPKFNAPLLTPLGDWSKTFRRLDREAGAKFRFSLRFDEEEAEDITLENENWTDKGLKFDSFTRLVLEGLQTLPSNVYYDNEVFTAFDTGFTSFYKTTALPEETAPAVSLRIEKGTPANLYVNPLVFYFNGFKFENNSSGSVTTTSGGGSWIYQWYSCDDPNPPAQRFPGGMEITTTNTDSQNYLLNYFFSFWERRLVLNDALREDTNGGLPLIYSKLRAMRLHSLARLSVIHASGTTQGYRCYPIVPPGHIPIYMKLCGVCPPGSGGVNRTASHAAASGFPVGAGSSFSYLYLLPEGALIAAINQGSKWFFIWRAD